jgi:hypothetical protein
MGKANTNYISQKSYAAGRQWLMPVIRRITVQSQPGQIVLETLS